MTTPQDPAHVFAVDLAALAREIAMDIYALPDVLRLHQVSAEEWLVIQENPRFKLMLEQMIRDWNSAASTRERTKIKAATGVESQLESLIGELGNTSIPLTQRVEAFKFLAGIGELTAVHQGGGTAPFSININIGDTRPIQVEVKPKLPFLDLPVIPEDDE